MYVSYQFDRDFNLYWGYTQLHPDSTKENEKLACNRFSFFVNRQWMISGYFFGFKVDRIPSTLPSLMAPLDTSPKHLRGIASHVKSATWFYFGIILKPDITF